MSFAGAGKEAVEAWKVSGGAVEKVTALGTFFVNALYLVYNKKGACIHMWYGNTKVDFTSADSVTWLEKAQELNASLGGLNVLVGEMEGFETNKFMSCFKSGVTYLTNATPGDHKLLQIKGKGGKRIKEVAMSSTYFASLKDVFILDAKEKIFIQAGPRASLYDRIAASSIADDINKSQRGDKSSIIYMYEDAMNEEFWGHFKSGSPASVVVIGHEEPMSALPAPTGPRLFKVNGPSSFTEIAGDTLSKGALASGGVFIVLSGGGDIVRRSVYVWVGKAADKSKAASAGFAFIKSNAMLLNTPLHIFPEGKESPVFMEQFSDWSYSSGFVPFSDALSLTSIKLPRKLLDAKMKAVNSDVDEGGKVRVWRVEGITRVTMNKTICGQFYSSNCYILLYAYTPQGMPEKYILLYWIGLNSSRDDRGSAAILTKYIADSLDGKKLIVRVVEGQEPPYLRRLFRGSLMIHRGSSPSAVEEAPKKKNSLLDAFSMKSKSEKGVNAVEQLSRVLLNSKAKGGNVPALYAYVGTTALTLYSLQVPLEASSLNSVDNFVLYSGNFAYIRVANPTHKDTIIKLAESKLRDIDGKAEFDTIAFNAGSEPEDFWSKLGGKASVNKQSSYLNKPKARHPRLYHATARSGAFRVSEVEYFKRTDLFDDEVFILDVFDVIICWVGAAVSTQENDLAVDYAMRLHESLCAIDKRSAEGVIVKVESGEEMSLLTDYFFDWDKPEIEEEDVEAEQISQMLQEMKIEYEANVAAEAVPDSKTPAERINAAKVNISEEMSPLEVVKKPVQAASVPVRKFPKVQTKEKKGPDHMWQKWTDFKQDMSFADIFPAVDPSKKYDYNMLKADYDSLKKKNIEINPLKKEEYLEEKIFEELFGCTKAEFDALPMWKKNEKKKKVGLF